MREREKHGFVVLLIYAFIGPFLAYQDDARTNGYIARDLGFVSASAVRLGMVQRVFL